MYVCWRCGVLNVYIVIVVLLLNILYLIVARVLCGGSHVRRRCPFYFSRTRAKPFSLPWEPHALPPPRTPTTCPPNARSRRDAAAAGWSVPTACATLHHTTRYQLVLRSWCTMTALRTIVGACHRYVKVSGHD